MFNPKFDTHQDYKVDTVVLCCNWDERYIFVSDSTTGKEGEIWDEAADLVKEAFFSDISRDQLAQKLSYCMIFVGGDISDRVRTEFREFNRLNFQFSLSKNSLRISK